MNEYALFLIAGPFIAYLCYRALRSMGTPIDEPLWIFCAMGTLLWPVMIVGVIAVPIMDRWRKQTRN